MSREFLFNDFIDIMNVSSIEIEIAKLTTLQWRILYFLSKKDSYALEMTEALYKKTACYVVPGTIYPSLCRLVEKGFLEKYDNDEQTKGRENSRKMYTITERGKEAIILFETQNSSLKET